MEQKTPKSLLTERYNKFMKDSTTSENYTATSINVKDINKSYWTSTFECPVTGHIFPAGTLKEFAHELEKDVQTCPSVACIDGKIYYLNKRDAGQAAAGRACDVLDSSNFFTSFGVTEHIPVPQFCVEDPYTFASRDTISEDGCANYDDDDDFVVQSVPQAGSTKQGSSGAIEAWLEAWVDATCNDPLKNMYGHDSYNDNNNIKIDAKTDAITTAKAWCAHMEAGIQNALEPGQEEKREKDKHAAKIFSLLQAPVTVGSCNIILKALGNINFVQEKSERSIQGNLESNDTDASFCIQNDSSSLEKLVANEIYNSADTIEYSKPVQERYGDDNENIEKIANEIIDLMITYGNSQSNSSHFKPDIDTFNQYLRCQHRATPYQSGLAAAKELDDALSGSSFHGVDVIPNIDSFNAVFQQFLVDNDDTKSKVNMWQLFQKLLNRDDIQPNKETFIVALKCVAKKNKNKIFNYEEASTWIECINAYSLQHIGTEFEIDIDFYNNFLLWEQDGRVMDGVCEDIFKHGFQSHNPNTNIAIMNAQNIEKWVSEMITPNTSPDLRTFEAMIQAWIRTGTEEGLNRAEYWADKVLDASTSNPISMPRLETFAPIITAWAQSGEETGVEKVAYWIDRLVDLSESHPNLAPDGQTRSKRIIALHRYQQIFLENQQVSKESLRQQRLDTAEECSSELFALVDMAKQSQRTMELNAAPFRATIDAWKNTLSSEMNQTEVNKSILEMFHALDTLYSLADKTYTSSTAFEDNQEKENESKYPLQNVLSLHESCAELYTSCMSSIRKSNVDLMADAYFHRVEKLLRLHEARSNNLKNAGIKNRSIEMYDEALEWCKALDNKTQYGDAIRVAVYVFDRCKDDYNRQSIGEYEMKGICLKVVDIVASVIPNDYEKILILNKLWTEINDIGIPLDADYFKSALTGDTQIDAHDLFLPPPENSNKRIPPIRIRQKYQ